MFVGAKSMLRHALMRIGRRVACDMNRERFIRIIFPCNSANRWQNIPSQRKLWRNIGNDPERERKSYENEIWIEIMK